MSNYKVTDNLNIRSGPGTNYDIIGTVNQDDYVVDVDTKGWIPIVLLADEEGGESVGWISAKYAEEYTGDIPDITPTPPKPVPPPPAPTGEPIWITWAKSKLGFKEGGVHEVEIESWYKITGLPQSAWDDEKTPWCAVFVSAAFHLNGITAVDSALAVDWLKFGTPTSNPQLGDVVVFDWGNGSHHVGFVLSVSGGMVHDIGGNQSSAVTMADYSTKYVMGYRRPPQSV